MFRNSLLLFLATAMVALGATSKAQAWGCAHAGFTHVGAGGVTHVGATGFGGYRGVGGYHYGGYGGVGYHGYGYGGLGYRGYGYGGVGYGAYPAAVPVPVQAAAPALNLPVAPAAFPPAPNPYNLYPGYGLGTTTGNYPAGFGFYPGSGKLGVGYGGYSYGSYASGATTGFNRSW